MSKLSDAINTTINSYKQRERFDDSRDIHKERGQLVIKKLNREPAKFEEVKVFSSLYELLKER